MINWESKHIVKVSNKVICTDEIDQKVDWRKIIEPWLTAIFQSEHLSLLAGTGLTTAITHLAKTDAQGMGRTDFGTFKNEIHQWADKSAIIMKRGEANFEDDIRTALELLKGLQIQEETEKAEILKMEIDEKLTSFIKAVLQTEKELTQSDQYQEALNYLRSFLVSFASRTATRDRLNIFTTNYDRLIEIGCDMAGIFTIDRFVGKLIPVFRTSKIELDYHYNPPGIRGEPRYVEGVTRLSKLHGSIDWKFEDGKITKSSLPFGASDDHPGVPKQASDHLVIYPNSSKGIDTAYFPYSELFRDFASAACRPNSILVIYGYGFGDSHINRIIADMLTIPSTHVVIISYDNAGGRINDFVQHNNLSQFTLLIGEHFGDFKTLVDEYLPKAAIDRLTERMQVIKDKRGLEDARKGNKDDIGAMSDE